MIKRLTILLLLLPGFIMAQVENNNGTLSIGFGKKKQAPKDTVQKQTPRQDEETPSPEKERKQKAARVPSEKSTPDFKKDGVFKGLFHAGLNACQVDGDDAWGYKYFGFRGGVGVMARFHRFFSVSVELNYSMKGAKPTYVTHGANANFYSLSWDYVEVPLALNIHVINPVMFSFGFEPGVMVRYKEIYNDGTDITAHPFLGQPRRFDLPVFGGVHIIFKKRFALGAMISYSTIKIRAPYSGTKVNGQYNNYLSFRFMYILGKKRK